MKPDDRHARAGAEPGRSTFCDATRSGGDRIKERRERAEFVVHRDAKCLEGLRRRMEPRRARPGAVGLPHEIRKLRRRRDRRNRTCSNNFRRDLSSERFFAESCDHLTKIALTRARDELRRGHAGRRIESHIKRPVAHETQAARGVVNLRRGEAKIGEDEIRRESEGVEFARDRRETCVDRFGRDAGRRAHSIAGEGEVRLIEIKKHDATRRSNDLRDAHGMTTTPSGQIDVYIIWAR